MSLRAPALWAALLVALVSALASIFPVSGCEPFFNLATGREAALTGRLVSGEFFSLTEQAGALRGSGWLGNLALYHIHNSFGIDGLVVFRAMVGAIVGLLVYLASGGTLSAGLFTIGAIALGMLGGWGMGPELFGYLIIAALMYLLAGYIEGSRGFRLLYIVPLLMLCLDALDPAGAFWASVYICVLIAALGFTLPSQRSLRGDALKRLRVLGIIAIASAGLIALHPHGLRAGGLEFGPARVSYAYLALAWAVALGLVYLRGRVSAHKAIVALVFLALAPFAESGTAVAAIVAVPLLAEALSKSHKPGSLARLAALCMVLLALGGLVYMKSVGPLRLGLGTISVPDASLEFIKSSGIRGRIYHPPEFRGCVAFYLYPGIRVMDSGSTLDERDITLALVTHAEGMDDEWAAVYWDRASGVYLRRVKENKKAVDAFELEHILPGAKPESTAPHLAPLIAREAAQLLEYQRNDSLADALSLALMAQVVSPDEGVRLAGAALKSNPDNIMLRAAWGLHLYQSGGGRDKARDAMEAGLRANPGMGQLALGLAYLDYDSGRYQQAYSAFDRLVSEGGPEARRALYGRALTLMKLGREEEGRRDLEQYLDKSLANVPANSPADMGDNPPARGK